MLTVCRAQRWSATAILVTGLILAGCGSSGTASSSAPATASTPAHSARPGTTPAVTSYWRQQLQGQYGYPVATGDGRGCAQASKTLWVCTGYVRNPNKNVDVYGTVTRQGQHLTIRAHLNHGSQITNWFTKTGGGCQTDSCAGTKIKGGA